LKAELSDLSFEKIYLAYWGLFLIPLLAIRKFLLRGMKNRDEVIGLGFKPKFSWIGFLLSAALRLEQILFPSRILGASLICVAKKGDR
jgi:hypothetical protein